MANFFFSEKFYKRGRERSKRTDEDDARQMLKTVQRYEQTMLKRHKKRPAPSLPKINMPMAEDV